ncbi:MAG: hypothetical protein OEM59_23445 [Rhodospirillales bacterium]|nr:hypothetical protein [Rhodospirillales bacterium]
MAVVKDMAMTLEDFLRGLPSAMTGLDYRVNGHSVEAGTPERRLSIVIEPQPPRRLGGLLAVPRARVTITFEGYDPAAEAEFVERFDRAFQRGGG